jgi:hypothetical protein
MRAFWENIKRDVSKAMPPPVLHDISLIRLRTEAVTLKVVKIRGLIDFKLGCFMPGPV